jgi:hypothetical protein
MKENSYIFFFLKTHLITTSYNFLQHFYTSKRKKNTIRRVPSHFTDFKQCIIYFFPFSFVSLVGQNNNGNKCGGYFSNGGIFGSLGHCCKLLTTWGMFAILALK